MEPCVTDDGKFDRFSVGQRANKERRCIPQRRFMNGGAPGAIRTHDTRFRRAVLCPLSYGGAIGIVAFRRVLRCETMEERRAHKISLVQA